MSHQVVPKKTYFQVFAALVVLTVVTTEAAMLDLGAFNTVTALAIATVKMLLVILFFMHVRSSSHLVKVAVVASFFWLALLISLTLSDVLTRDWTPAPSGWDTTEVIPPTSQP